MNCPALPHALVDFRDPLSVAGWFPIDDRIMGGVSQSRLHHHPAGHAVFDGEVSLERNGGFASVRSRPGAWGAPGARASLIEARGGAGKQFKLTLFMDDGVDSLSYQASFTADTSDWQDLRLPIETFQASFRGRVVPGAAPLEPALIRQVGLMIAAQQAGHFALDIRQISLAR
ncbi:MAG: hypothetical protein RL375_4084 [Pseudomonadota bacterium]